jgi:outer membrane immunogenic protein
MVGRFCVFRGLFMKKLAYVVAVAGLIGTPAFAADMAVKAPAPAPAPVYNWTGWYVGGNVGASFGRVKTDFNAAPVTVGIISTPASTLTIPGSAGSNTESPSGFMGGGQIGYNWQYSPLIVVGLEADFQGALERDHNTTTNSFSVPTSPSIFTGTGTTVLDYQTKIDWFGTVRARIGYVWGNGDVLTYVTGGLAYGKVDIEGTSTVSGTVASLPFSITHAIGHSHVNTGWVVGFGTEGKLLIPGWTYKIESLYMDLGHINDTDVALCPEGGCSISSVTGGQTITHTHFTDGILRLGVNYQFH